MFSLTTERPPHLEYPCGETCFHPNASLDAFTPDRRKQNKTKVAIWGWCPAGYDDLLETPPPPLYRAFGDDPASTVRWQGESDGFYLGQRAAAVSRTPQRRSTAMSTQPAGCDFDLVIPTTPPYPLPGGARDVEPHRARIQRRASFGVSPPLQRTNPPTPPRGELPADAPDCVVIVVRRRVQSALIPSGTHLPHQHRPWPIRRVSLGPRAEVFLDLGLAVPPERPSEIERLVRQRLVTGSPAPICRSPASFGVNHRA